MALAATILMILPALGQTREHGFELRKYDGTSVSLVQDIIKGSAGSSPVRAARACATPCTCVFVLCGEDVLCGEGAHMRSILPMSRVCLAPA